jgi:hypothetical protein
MITAGLLVTALLGACTSGGGTDSGTQRPTATPVGAWSVVTPPDFSPTALTTARGALLVGGASPAGTPALAVGSGGSWRQVPVTPVSGYGKQATLVHLAADRDGGVVAIGTATGGAHLNPRWTAWIGTVDGGITEEPQTVETFGGPDAGGITGVTAGNDPLVVGTWSVGAGGLAVATWRHSGAVWQREPTTDALSGTGDAQTTATAAASTTVHTVIVGLETSLPGGTVHQQAVAWTRPRAGGEWTRIDLDVSPVDSAATDVACNGDSCVVVGRLGDRLAVWRLSGVDTIAPAGKAADVAVVPDVPVRTIGRFTGQPRVAMSADGVAVADGVSTVVVSAPFTPGGGEPAAWRVIDTAPGEVRELTLTGIAVQVLARPAGGPQDVYSHQL